MSPAEKRKPLMSINSTKAGHPLLKCCFFITLPVLLLLILVTVLLTFLLS